MRNGLNLPWESSFGDLLKLKFQVELYTSWRLSGHRRSIKGRTNHSDVSDIIFMIQNIERVDRQRRSWSVLSCPCQYYGMGEVEVEIDVSRSV
jgi:hypothetical protein